MATVGKIADLCSQTIGKHLSASSVYKAFKRVVEEIGSPDTRFHDLRHSYAVAAIKSGDDIKTVLENFGHATAAFTLDVYGHVTEKNEARKCCQNGAVHKSCQQVNFP